MNAKQTQILQIVKTRVEEFETSIGSKIKSVSIDESEITKAVYVVIISHMDSPSALAQAVTFKYRSIRIGKNGGLRLLNAKNKSKNFGLANVLYGKTEE